MIEVIKDVLKGIDQTEIESPDGWWETSDGAKFGAKKLQQIIELLDNSLSSNPVAWINTKDLESLKKGIEGVYLVYEEEMVNSVPLYEKF